MREIQAQYVIKETYKINFSAFCENLFIYIPIPRFNVLCKFPVFSELFATPEIIRSSCSHFNNCKK